MAFIPFSDEALRIAANLEQRHEAWIAALRGAERCDRALPQSDLGRELPLLVYGPTPDRQFVILLRELPCRIALAASAPS